MTTLAKKILAPALALFVATSARAQTTDEHVARATRFYNLQDWPNALEEYKTAYRDDPRPELLWSIAQVERLSGDCRSAIFTYEAYARGASASGAAASRDLIDKCRATLAAAEHAVAAPKQPRPAPPAPRPIEKKKPWILDPLGDALALVAFGGLASGTALVTLGNFGIAASSSAPTYQAYDRAVAVAHTEQQLGVGLAIGGCAFAGLALWRFVVLSSRARREISTFVVAPAPGGATLTVRF